MDEVERLVEQLKSVNVISRASAALQLGKIKDKRAVPALMEALKDDDGFVRGEAVWALGDIEDAAAVPVLIEMLKEENQTVRLNAAVSLGKIGVNDGQLAVIIGMLRSGDEYERMGSAWALGSIGDASAVTVLIEALKDKSAVVRSTAASALGWIGDASAVTVLIEALKDKYGGVRDAAPGALENIAKQCKSIEELEKVEKCIDEGSAALRKKHVDKRELIEVQIKIARLTSIIAQKKNGLASKRDLLLTEKPPKPSKRGRGVHQEFRMTMPRRLARA